MCDIVAITFICSFEPFHSVAALFFKFCSTSSIVGMLTPARLLLAVFFWAPTRLSPWCSRSRSYSVSGFPLGYVKVVLIPMRDELRFFFVFLANAR